VAAFRRAAGRQALHVVREPLDVVGRVLHVIADVIGIGLSVFLSLLKTALSAGMRTGVIDGLSLGQ
jgi:hypothetical protein